MAKNIEGAEELILHPVRLKVVQALIAAEMTTAQLAETMPGVPVPSLYRHVARLVEGGVLEVAAERHVRGAVERTYRLVAGGTSPEGQFREFAAFAGSLIGGFGAYLAKPSADASAGMVGYGQAELWLTPAELQEFAGKMSAALREASEHSPGEGRTAVLFTTVVFPVDGAPGA